MKYIEDAVDDARKAKEREKAAERRRKAGRWYRNVPWGAICGVTFAAACLVAIIWFMVHTLVSAYNEDDATAAHYKKDFTTFCTQLNGKTDTSDSENYYCYGPDKKILMYSGNDGYNADFKRFCEDRGGKAVIGNRDLCTKDGREIMRESKYGD